MRPGTVYDSNAAILAAAVEELGGLPVPLGIPLRGVIEYGIVCGQLQPGERLPPVRAMARQLGIAPMTVSQVYKELKEVGLLETKQGTGTFVSSSVGAQMRSELLGLQQRIDQLLEDAGKLARIPGIIVQGRYDLLCPPATSHARAERWSDAEIRIVEGAGHTLYDPGVRDAVMRAIADMASKIAK